MYSSGWNNILPREAPAEYVGKSGSLNSRITVTGHQSRHTTLHEVTLQPAVSYCDSRLRVGAPKHPPTGSLKVQLNLLGSLRLYVHPRNEGRGPWLRSRAKLDGSHPQRGTCREWPTAFLRAATRENQSRHPQTNLSPCLSTRIIEHTIVFGT